MKINSTTIIVYAVIVLAIIAGVWFYTSSKKQPGQYDQFAQCLKEKGLIFYGAFWCPHCQNQKAMFGNSVKYLPYVECSTPNGQSQLDVCKKENVTGYPTWVYPDGSRESGEIEMSRLAEKSGCQLPK
ncbi:MAG: hypothetical protein A2633_00050 [Candidatus Sungbacteria bacterium RIFCSPHIGHO2_01_FULL_47_32]|uniref:Thioredoxin domain-containing protein n=1 Tax=Candidatus Sungbacteria bacterium RIFCSPHIGHO2_01_FULL_47_32 TaxID=1802264 RepID=A0A1G2K8X1_9BACT|nr:MAG: hypothetical protein UX72_C0042G0003 [Parcubacteria group bacterium GW2011_GWA2_47_10]OGZ94858.1 MAG: hypothetical protein A2633_00050 [Candidatus Sungbacteria bacterium RIFCSPHIGHO2_01_FULL_47_32]